MKDTCKRLVEALKANIKDPTNVTWREVLRVLRELEAEQEKG